MGTMSLIVGHQEFEFVAHGVFADVLKIAKKFVVFLRVVMERGFVKNVPRHHPNWKAVDRAAWGFPLKRCRRPPGCCDRQNSSPSAPFC